MNGDSIGNLPLKLLIHKDTRFKLKNTCLCTNTIFPMEEIFEYTDVAITERDESEVIIMKSQKSKMIRAIPSYINVSEYLKKIITQNKPSKKRKEKYTHKKFRKELKRITQKATREIKLQNPNIKTTEVSHLLGIEKPLARYYLK